MQDKIAREQIEGIIQNINRVNGTTGNIVGEIKKIKSTIENQERLLSMKPVSPIKDYVECSKCHCLVNRKYAHKEQTLVEKQFSISYEMMKTCTTLLGGDSSAIEQPDKVIQTDYYCKRCYQLKQNNDSKTKTKGKMRKKSNRK